MVAFRNSLALSLAAALWSLPARAEPALYADDRDHFTLLDQHLLNRQLFLQLSSEEQAFRLGRRWPAVALAMDGAIGSQQTPDDSMQSRFHGYYLADTYLAARPFDGLEANLNVLLFNPSASDGYRLSSQMSAGLALHGFYELGSVRLDLLGTDLGWVTTGAGLMLEQTPLEGVRVTGSWRDLSLDWMYGGRALWDDDDYIVYTLAYLQRLIQLRFVEWHKGDDGALPVAFLPDEETPIRTTWFVGASTDLTVAEQWHLAGEIATRLDDRAHSAFMWRADYLTRELPWLDLHAAYQVRWYDAGFGPAKGIDEPSATFNVPRREDQYVTNSFEYLGISADYEQWSHTLMLEGRVRPFSVLELFAEVELWWRYALARSATTPPATTPQGFEAPGSDLSAYYRIGLSVYPWPALPHRLSGFLTNKQVESAAWSAVPQLRRYDPGTYLVVELEAFF